MPLLCRLILAAVVLFSIPIVTPQPAQALACTVFSQVAQVCTFGQDGTVIGCNSMTFQDYRCSGGRVGYPFGPPPAWHHGGGSGSSSSSSHGNPLSLSTRAKLSSAKSTAIAALAENQECRDLAKDSEALGQTLIPARTDIAKVIGELTTYRDWSQHEVCTQTSAAAFTTPYTTTTYICKRTFESLSNRQRAAILIHEALHTAGLLEKPQYAGAEMTTQQITQYVYEKCPNL